MKQWIISKLISEAHIQNGMGKDLTNITISIGVVCNWKTLLPDLVLPDGEKDNFLITCVGPIIGSRFKEDISIEYTAGSGGLSHNITGDLTTQIE